MITVLGWRCCRSCCKLLFTYPSKAKRLDAHFILWVVVCACLYNYTLIDVHGKWPLFFRLMMRNTVDGFASVGNQGDGGWCMTYGRYANKKEKKEPGNKEQEGARTHTHTHPLAHAHFNPNTSGCIYTRILHSYTHKQHRSDTCVAACMNSEREKVKLLMRK